jgi:hypothetical protein
VEVITSRGNFAAKVKTFVEQGYSPSFAVLVGLFVADQDLDWTS